MKYTIVFDIHYDHDKNSENLLFKFEHYNIIMCENQKNTEINNQYLKWFLYLFYFLVLSSISNVGDP